MLCIIRKLASNNTVCAQYWPKSALTRNDSLGYPAVSFFFFFFSIYVSARSWNKASSFIQPASETELQYVTVDFSVSRTCFCRQAEKREWTYSKSTFESEKFKKTNSVLSSTLGVYSSRARWLGQLYCWFTLIVWNISGWSSALVYKLHNVKPIVSPSISVGPL